MRLSNLQFVLIAVGAVGLGTGLSFLFGTDSRSSAPAAAGPTIVLADPIDPPERRMPEPSTPVPEVTESAEQPAKRSDLIEKATSGDRGKLTAAKEALKKRVASGNGTDSEARMLRALCRQLGDESCAN